MSLMLMAVAWVTLAVNAELPIYRHTKGRLSVDYGGFFTAREIYFI